jgi:hypothetical protein
MIVPAARPTLTPIAVTRPMDTRHSSDTAISDSASRPPPVARSFRSGSNPSRAIASSPNVLKNFLISS